MPPLLPIALRYLAWLIGLRVLYVIITMLTSFPSTLATVVILAAAPAIEIGIFALRKAQTTIDFAGWVKIWAVMFAVYTVINVVLPTLLISQMRLAIMDGSGLNSVAIVTASTAALLALFLWIGRRIGLAGRS